MVRRVKAYLKTMKVITNEEELHKMSLECEPPIGGLHPLHSLNSTAVTAPTMVRKRNPSPSPSAVSSSSSTPSHYSTQGGEDKRHAASNKFGAASPQAVKKLLSLSEATKPRHKQFQPQLQQHHQPQHQPQQQQQQQHSHVLSPPPVEPVPVNLTSESSSVTSRPKVRKVQQNSVGSITSTDSGFGAEHRLGRGESPQLPPRRRYHNHYHRQHNHGKSVLGLSVHHAVPVEVCPSSPEPFLARQQMLPRVPAHRPQQQTFYIQPQEEEDDETQVSAV